MVKLYRVCEFVYAAIFIAFVAISGSQADAADLPDIPAPQNFERAEAADAVDVAPDTTSDSPFDLTVEEIRTLQSERDALDAWLRTLPQHEGFYIVDGDLRRTRTQISDLLAQRLRALEGDGAEAPAETSLSQNPEALLACHEGRPSYWPAENRALTYAVDRASFPTPAQADDVTTWMKAAAKSWVNACEGCGLAIDHRPEHDAAPSHDNVTFIVRATSGAVYHASAFFPHDPVQSRDVVINDSFYNMAFSKVGILRHELGHVLGFVHEHIAAATGGQRSRTRAVSGCDWEGGEWNALTHADDGTADTQSVMHYPCGGREDKEYALSAADITALLAVYGSDADLKTCPN